MGAQTDDVVLDVRDLRTHIIQSSGSVKAVDGVSFAVRRGEIVGLVGESGSGKTMTCLSIMRLMPVSTARILAGEIWFEGTDLLKLDEADVRTYRGRRIAMIMQDPLAALNPVLTVGDQVSEPLRYHLGSPKKSALAKAIEMLTSLRVPRPADRVDEYPHQFSGGMRQRIVAAMGLTTSPALVIADEPTTALDVTIQAQFLKLIRELQRSAGMSVLWVTHDVGVVAQICDRVNVMYAGRIVESGDVRRVLNAPRHPYTIALMRSVPRLGTRRERLYQIDGQPPDLRSLPPGCPFVDRCPLRMPICGETYPPATPVSGGYVYCWAADKTGEAIASSVTNAPSIAAGATTP